MNIEFIIDEDVYGRRNIMVVNGKHFQLDNSEIRLKTDSLTDQALKILKDYIKW